MAPARQKPQPAEFRGCQDVHQLEHLCGRLQYTTRRCSCVPFGRTHGIILWCNSTSRNVVSIRQNKLKISRNKSWSVRLLAVNGWKTQRFVIVMYGISDLLHLSWRKWRVALVRCRLEYADPSFFNPGLKDCANNGHFKNLDHRAIEIRVVFARSDSQKIQISNWDQKSGVLSN